MAVLASARSAIQEWLAFDFGSGCGFSDSGLPNKLPVDSGSCSWDFRCFHGRFANTKLAFTFG